MSQAIDTASVTGCVTSSFVWSPLNMSAYRPVESPSGPTLQTSCVEPPNARCSTASTSVDNAPAPGPVEKLNSPPNDAVTPDRPGMKFLSSCWQWVTSAG